MKYNRILEKQIQKTLSPEQLEDPGMQQFLELVNRSYTTFENDKKLADHAFIITEQEYQEVLTNLQLGNDIQKESAKKLRQAIISLDPYNSLLHTGDDDLISIISYLQEQIQRSKDLRTELLRAKDEAESAAKAKGEFLSVMSHEIRTPLNAIIGIAHLLMQDELLPAQLENLRILNISAENLLNLINDILDFGKIEEGRIILSEKNIDLRDLASNIRMANRIRAEERGNVIKLITDPHLPVSVMADDVRLGQVLNNLVSNAVKFTRNGIITIELRMDSIGKDDVRVHFTVSDTGIGIAKEKQQVVFDRFTQASSEISREFGGSGLGLAIVKRLLTMYNSDIHLQSEPDKGSQFSFYITFKKGTGEPLKVNHSPKGHYSLNGLRVLLVEDVEFNVMVAEKMILNWNASIDIAENGLVAVSKARQQQYDIILMDLQMPVMDGYSASKHIRSFDEQTPIIALTASASPDMLGKIKEFGINDFLPKPFKPADLYEVICRNTTAGIKKAI